MHELRDAIYASYRDVHECHVSGGEGRDTWYDVDGLVGV